MMEYDSDETTIDESFVITYTTANGDQSFANDLIDRLYSTVATYDKSCNKKSACTEKQPLKYNINATILRLIELDRLVPPPPNTNTATTTTAHQQDHHNIAFLPAQPLLHSPGGNDTNNSTNSIKPRRDPIEALCFSGNNNCKKSSTTIEAASHNSNYHHNSSSSTSFSIPTTKPTYQVSPPMMMTTTLLNVKPHSATVPATPKSSNNHKRKLPATNTTTTPPTKKPPNNINANKVSNRDEKKALLPPNRSDLLNLPSLVQMIWKSINTQHKRPKTDFLACTFTTAELRMMLQHCREYVPPGSTLTHEQLACKLAWLIKEGYFKELLLLSENHEMNA